MQPPTKTRDQLRQVANLALLPLGAFYAYLPRADGESIGEISRRSEPLLSASRFVFIIWALIYAGQIGYAAYQGLPGQTRRPLHRRIGGLSVANALLGALWTFAFTSQAFTFAWFILVAMLANLVVIEHRMGRDAENGKARWLVRLPFSLNLGWIAVATVLGTTQFLHSVVGYEGAPFTPVIWANALVLLAVGLGGFLMIRRSNFAAALAIAWGLVGIATHASGVATSLMISATGGAIALTGLGVLELVTRRRGRPTKDARPSVRIHPMRPVV